MRTSIPKGRRLKIMRYRGRLGGYQGYKSRTIISKDEFVGTMEIELVWFISLGWYYHVTLEGWINPSKYCYLNSFTHETRRSIECDYRPGPLLEKCAEDADQAAFKLLAKYGLSGLKLAQFKYTVYY